MDARTAKRVAQVQQIKGKPYYARVAKEPDPVESCSTRMWKFKMRSWVQELKTTRTCDQDQLPQHEEDPAHDVMASSQGRLTPWQACMPVLRSPSSLGLTRTQRLKLAALTRPR